MFKKTTSPGERALADRVRQFSQAKPLAPSAPSAPIRQSSEKRDPREPLFRNGTLIFDDGERMSVVIKNLSSSGARIEFFVNRELPAHVTLTEPMMKLRRVARVAWQRDGAAGLTFSE